jgi:glycosyltransferase involved in cell wall biosynthesis
MKIAFYISTLRGGGAEGVFVNLINYSLKAGYEVVLLLNRMGGEKLNFLDPGVNIVKLDAGYAKKSVTELKNFIDSQSPDVVISTLSHCNYALILANILSRKKTKVIVREANSFLSQRKSLPRIKLIREFIKVFVLYRFADTILVNSENSRAELAKITRLNSNRIILMRNPVDLNRIISQSNLELNGRIKSFINNSNIILGVGRLEESKDFATLIRAFSLLKHENCKLVILGEGTLRPRLELLISNLNLENKVLMPGYLSNPYNVIKKSKVYVLSSIYEGMPNSLIEALILNIPVVSTDCPGGPRDLLKDSRNGILVKVSDPDGMASAIEKQLSDNKVMPGKNQFTKYSLDYVGDTFISLLNDLVKND